LILLEKDRLEELYGVFFNYINSKKDMDESLNTTPYFITTEKKILIFSEYSTHGKIHIN